MMVYLLLVMISAFSIEDTQVLPKGVRSVMWKQGVVGSITNRFGNDNTLYSLDGRLSKNFDANEILKLHPRAPELIDALNNTLPSKYQLGNQIQLGELRFDGDASVHYSAPVMAYGITEKWTLGLAVPFVKLEADIQVKSGGNNNTKEIYNAIARDGQLSEELDREFKRLMNLDLKQAFHDQLHAKSYQPLEANDKWQLGDVQLVSKYRYYETERWGFLNKILFNAPTGPEDDPNHLLDLPMLHRTFIEVSQVQDYKWSRSVYLGTAFTYKWNLPDSIEKRVPRYQGDYLPDTDRLENVDRDIGDAYRWEANIRKRWSHTLSSSVAYIGEYKNEDYYTGSKGYNYSLLSENTDAVYHKLEANISYSSVDNFLDKKALFPFLVSYKYSDIFSGRNIERQEAHELTFMVFF